MKGEVDQLSHGLDGEIEALREELMSLEMEIADAKVCQHDLVNNLKLTKKIQKSGGDASSGQAFAMNVEQPNKQKKRKSRK